MSHSRPDVDEIVQLQRQLQGASDASDLPYDVRWARRILLGEEVSPPEVLRSEVIQVLIEELLVRKAVEHLTRLARQRHKSVAKAARTALHRLRSQKLEVSIPPPPRNRAVARAR